jgi:hypothetical protein
MPERFNYGASRRSNWHFDQLTLTTGMLTVNLYEPPALIDHVHGD